MLEEVRRSAKSGLSYIMVAGLIVIFAFFFGVPADSCGGGGALGARRHVASIDGEDVHTNDLNVLYNRTFGTRDRGDEEQIQRQQAMTLKSYLIIQLLAHKAREAGLRVSEQEFKEFMANPATHLTEVETSAYMRAPLNVPEFRAAYGNNGSWDGDFYKRYVQNMLRVSLPDYEQFRRDEMLARKYLNLVDMQIGVLPQEIEASEKIRNTEINLEFAKFDPNQLADFVQVDDEQVAQFIANNKDKIEKYYEDNADQYSDPAKLEVRRIYLERGKDGPDGKSAEERFEQAQKRIDAGEDFATVAGEINDALKDQQGLMPMTSVENMSQDIVQALEDAEVGQVREIKNDNELMLVKLVDKQEAVTTPLSDVQDEIARNLLQQQKVDELIADLSNQLIAKAKETGSLSQALAALESGGAAAQQGQDGQDAAPQDAEQNAGQEGDTEAQKSVWSAVQVDETGGFTLEGQDMSSMFRGQLPAGISLGRAPWDRIPKIGQSRKLAVDAFTQMSEDKPLVEKPYKVDDSTVVVRLKSKTNTAKTQGAEGEGADGKGAEGEEAQASAAGANQELLREIRDQKTNTVLGNWQMLFLQPRLEYGPWLEQQFEEAVNSGLIELDQSAGKIVSLIDPNAQPAAPTEGIPLDMPSSGSTGGGPSGSAGGSGE